MSALDKGVRHVPAVCVRDGAWASQEACVVVEEPLEIRVAGEPLALTMRTPGDDRSLALGFLYAEGVLTSLEDVGGVHHCGRTDDPRYGNVIEVVPGPGARLDVDALDRTRRVGVTHSACGVCGRDGIDDLLARIQPVHPHLVPSQLIAQSPASLARHQAQFTRTGGLHAACAIAEDGQVLAAAEDVGRHNAVDKVLGKLLLGGLLPRHTGALQVLAVSSRASFEIVQKAAAAGFACVSSVSAPSSLAIDTAGALNVVLASFVRDDRFTLYSLPERVSP